MIENSEIVMAFVCQAATKSSYDGVVQERTIRSDGELYFTFASFGNNGLYFAGTLGRGHPVVARYQH
jgi:hypothetical protein